MTTGADDGVVSLWELSTVETTEGAGDQYSKLVVTKRVSEDVHPGNWVTGIRLDKTFIFFVSGTLLFIRNAFFDSETLSLLACLCVNITVLFATPHHDF